MLGHILCRPHLENFESELGEDELHARMTYIVIIYLFTVTVQLLMHRLCTEDYKLIIYLCAI